MLSALSDQLNVPKTQAYRRPDGIGVVPLGLLAP